MNAEWIMSFIEDVSKFGQTYNGGVNRLGFTEIDCIATDYVISILKDLGFIVDIDSFGNIFAKLNDNVSNNKIVATGSHLDTVPNGGIFDGVLGVASSIAAIMAIKKEGIKLSHPLELIIFRLEESSRFGCPTMGSKVISGKYQKGMWDNLRDRDNISLFDAMKKSGFNLNNAEKSIKSSENYKSFIELHIDSGGDLYRACKPIGIAEAIAAPLRAKVTIHGEISHSGAANMKDRKDALVSAAEFILSVRNFAMAYADMGIRATVGSIDAFPNAINVVCGLAELYVDLRGTDKSIMDEVYNLIKNESSKIALRRKTPIEISFISEEYPVKMDNHIYSIIKSSCNDLGIDSQNIISGAGHDAMNMANITPSGMIFVRGSEGGSHRIDEYASLDDINLGLSVLKDTLCRLAY